MTALQPKRNRTDYLLLLVITLIVYWPLSLHLFSLKNDALSVFLPYRYHLSEAIRNGHFPFWDPYLFTGIPIHADMQSGVWNPFVLIISLFTKYNMSVLQWEVLIYLYLSAIGMYRLIRHLGFARPVCICCAVSFMCCGYMTDSISVVPWITSAAFIPFVLLYFLHLLKQPAFSMALKFALSLSLMFLCGYPSFFIVLNYVLAAGFFIWIVVRIRENNKAVIRKTILGFALAYFVFFLLCSPAIISYYEFLPYYSRGTGLSFSRAVTNPFVPFSFISYFIPNAPSRADFLATDVSMRNAYIGVFMFIFFVAGLWKPDSFRKTIIGFSLFFLLFSLGNLVPVQRFCYSLLPLMDTFRHPGTFRVFTSIGMIILAAYALESFLKGKISHTILRLCFFSLIILLTAIIIFLLNGKSHTNGFAISLNDPGSIKGFISSISFEKFAAILAGIQLVFVTVFIAFQYKKEWTKKAMLPLIVLNSVVFAWIALPFTVVSQHKTKEVNQYIASFPTGFPYPGLDTPIGSDVYTDSTTVPVLGYPNFYDKKITIQDYIITPTLNADYGLFLKNKDLRSAFKGTSFVYVADRMGAHVKADIKLKKFTPDHFLFEINSAAPGRLVMFQQYNHNWLAKLNDQDVSIQKANLAFMSIEIPAGRSIVEWTYRPLKVYIAICLSLACLIGILFYFVIQRKSKPVHA